MMNKILRLSLFNLKKNRKEAIAIAFLTMVSTLMLGLFAINLSKMNNTFDESFVQSGSVNTLLIMPEEDYRDSFADILQSEYDVENLETGYILEGDAPSVLRDGDKIAYNLEFITWDENSKIDDGVIIDALPDEQIEDIDHWIYLPAYYKFGAGYEPGDTFTVIIAGREYPFTIAGFYNTGISNETGMLLKTIISSSDYRLLKPVLKLSVFMAFDADDDFSYMEFIGKCMDESGDSLEGYCLDRETEKSNETQFLNMFLYMSISFALITFVASVFMARNKISHDIEDQMEIIGVLEALGYRGNEISLSYVYEYVISCGIGGILGGIIALLMTPFMDNAIKVMLGREVVAASKTYMVIPVVFGVIALILLVALAKASMVKKFPPVVAFRRGIRTHHFRRNVLPLSKLRGNINTGLAFKDALRNIRSGVGVGICIFLAGTTLLFCMFSFVFFFHGSDGLVSVMGIEMCDEYIILNSGVDPYEISAELLAMPEVRRTEVTYYYPLLRVVGSENSGTVAVYDDYDDVENIHPMAGRCPEHENEIMISLGRHRIDGVDIGDTLVVDRNGVQTGYVVTGIVGAMANNQMNLFLTTDGYRRANGSAAPDVIEVYLEDGVDREQFEQKMVSVYGQSAETIISSSSDGATDEERIRAAADEAMAVLISQYGITSVDYAVRIGDQLITGNSRQFVMKDFLSYTEIVKVQFDPIANVTRVFTLTGAIVIGIIVAVILGIIASSNVKRKRKDLGVMKSLGYSSKDLMIQMAVSIMPMTIVSVILASVAAVYINKYFWILLFGAVVKTNVPVLILTDIGIVVFTFLMTYIGAGKIKKISVTELMTE